MQSFSIFKLKQNYEMSCFDKIMAIFCKAIVCSDLTVLESPKTKMEEVEECLYSVRILMEHKYA